MSEHPEKRGNMNEIVTDFILPVASVTVGVVVVIWQIRRQATIAIAQNLHSKRLELKLNVYEEAAPILAEAQHGIRNLIGFATKQRLELSRISIVNKNGSLPTIRTSDLSKLKREFSENLATVFTYTERWEIIDKRLPLVRLALAVALHDVNEIYDEYFRKCLEVLPTENPETKEILPWRLPVEDARTALDKLADALEEELFTCMFYLLDAQVQLQNLLVGELFENRIEPRIPIDPRKKVLNLDRFDELNEYFRNETSWGKQQEETNEKIRTNISE